MYPVLVSEFQKIVRQPPYSTFHYRIGDTSMPINVNATAEEIFILCDGECSVDNIKKTLSKKYSENIAVVSEFVDEFLEHAIKNMHVRLLEKKLDKGRELIGTAGSYDYWTPEVVVFELTTACPLNCKHCYVDKSVPVTMDSKLLNDVIDEIIHLEISQTQLTGGEPLLHPNIKEVISKLHSAGIFTHIFTSGYVSEETTDFLLTCPSDKILFQVSLDGFEEYHDTFRNRSGAFEKTSRFIQKMASAGFKVHIGVSVLSQTEEYLEKLCNYCKTLGVAVMRIGPVSARGEAEKNNIQRTFEHTEWVSQIQRRLADKMNCENFRLLVEASMQPNEYRKNCGLGQTLLKIAPNGDVTPCNVSDMAMGNLANESIVSVLIKKSKLFEALTMPNLEICHECKYKLLCKDCVIEGLLYAKDVECCHWYEQNQMLFQKIWIEGDRNEV